jgi:hypothetical protein
VLLLATSTAVVPAVKFAKLGTVIGSGKLRPMVCVPVIVPLFWATSLQVTLPVTRALSLIVTLSAARLPISSEPLPSTASEPATELCAITDRLPCTREPSDSCALFRATAVWVGQPLPTFHPLAMTSAALRCATVAGAGSRASSCPHDESTPSSATQSSDGVRRVLMAYR